MSAFASSSFLSIESGFESGTLGGPPRGVRQPIQLYCLEFAKCSDAGELQQFNLGNLELIPKFFELVSVLFFKDDFHLIFDLTKTNWHFAAYVG